LKNPNIKTTIIIIATYLKSYLNPKKNAFKFEPVSEAGALKTMPVAILDKLIIIKKLKPKIRFQINCLGIFNFICMQELVVYKITDKLYKG
jgi:hypothetical protein